MRPQLTTSLLTTLTHICKPSTRYIPSLPTCAARSTLDPTHSIAASTIPRRYQHAQAAAVQQPPHITTTNMASTTSSVVSAASVIELMKNRRSYYALGKDLTISKERIQEIVNDAMYHVPSSFNSQSNRVIVLFGAEHDKFWDITEEVLRGIVPAENWKHTGDRLAGFKAGAGTIMFFEDQSVVQDFQAKFAVYKDKFPVWATQSDAMLQYSVWLGLEAEGLGANLQHYNPIVDERVAAQWNVPSSWQLNAQLVFGNRAAPAGERTYSPLEDRVKVYGA